MIEDTNGQTVEFDYDRNMSGDLLDVKVGGITALTLTPTMLANAVIEAVEIIGEVNPSLRTDLLRRAASVLVSEEEDNHVDPDPSNYTHIVDES